MTTMYWNNHRALFSSAPEGTHNVLYWWMHSDTGINSSIGCWPSLQGGGMPTHGITQKMKGGGVVCVCVVVGYNEIKSDVLKGVADCKTAKQENWEYLIHAVSQTFPEWPYLDEKRRCGFFCVESRSARAQCWVFTLPCLFVVQLLKCEFLNYSQKFPCRVSLRD